MHVIRAEYPSLRRARSRPLGMATVLKWNGTDVPDELRKLPQGRYVIESVDAMPALTPEQEQGLEEALDALDRGEGAELGAVRADLDALVRR
jgi:hypothetical protein